MTMISPVDFLRACLKLMEGGTVGGGGVVSGGWHGLCVSQFAQKNQRLMQREAG